MIAAVGMLVSATAYPLMPNAGLAFVALAVVKFLCRLFHGVRRPRPRLK